MGAGGQWAAGEGVVDGAHGFRVVKISSLKLWYSFYTRVEYQRLHEKNFGAKKATYVGDMASKFEAV